MEEREVMDVLCIPSGQENSLLAESLLTLSIRPQNRYSLAVFVVWQQIGEYTLPLHQQIRSSLTGMQPSNGKGIPKR